MKALRYASVSMVGVFCTQSLILLLHGFGDMAARPANVLAVMVSAFPDYLLNRRWVWGKSGKSHFRREVAPFWGFALVGLLLSTLFVGIVESRTDRTWPVLAANLAGFGVLWVARFFVLDKILFKGEIEHESILEHLAEDAPLA